MRRSVTHLYVGLAALAAACAGALEGPRPEDWMRVGVEPGEEAVEVEAALREAGWTRTERRAGDGFVALAFERGEQYAVRVVSRRGVVVALDSHEPDGLRERHGRVSLPEPPRSDLDGDGREDVLVARDDDAGERCLAVVRVDPEGRAEALPIAGDALATGACASALTDVDGDGRLEAMVSLRWPQLAVRGEVPGVDAPLVLTAEGWRPDGLPASHEASETEARRAALEAAREGLDVGVSVRLGVELAALAHLSGAAMSAQVERFDAALEGLVLEEADAARVAEIRAAIALGWRAPDGACATESGSCDGEEEERRPR